MRLSIENNALQIIAQVEPGLSKCPVTSHFPFSLCVVHISALLYSIQLNMERPEVSNDGFLWICGTAFQKLSFSATQKDTIPISIEIGMITRTVLETFSLKLSQSIEVILPRSGGLQYQRCSQPSFIIVAHAKISKYCRNIHPCCKSVLLCTALT